MGCSYLDRSRGEFPRHFPHFFHHRMNGRSFYNELVKSFWINHNILHLMPN
jgi:hypothetical protein